MLYKVQLQQPYSIIPDEIISKLPIQKIEPFDSSKIYEYDLFNTYKLEIAKPEKPDYVKAVPPPPLPIETPLPKIEQPKFLDPLPITLTGVFMLHDDALNRAIIMDNKSKAETTYKIGDEIEDAQLVKIFSNKILLIRSNGQQEMLYLRQEDATADEMISEKKDWSHVVKKTAEAEYFVDKQEFAYEVKSLGNIIDLFNLTTAYKHGKSIGTKIGPIEVNSLASNIGFKSGDIITMIADLPATTTAERLQIYKHVTQLPNDSTFHINIIRREKSDIIKIKVGIIKPVPTIPPLLPTKEPQKLLTKIEKYFGDQQEADKIKILQTKEKFAPTLQEIRLKERENILKHQKETTKKKNAIGEDKQ